MDLSTEDFTKRWLTLSEAAALLPRRRRGRKVAASTLWRWSRYGLHGVYLRVWAIGGSGTCTTREALEAFFDELTAAKGLQRAKPASKGSDAAIDAELASKGLLSPRDEG